MLAARTCLVLTGIAALALSSCMPADEPVAETPKPVPTAPPAPAASPSDSAGPKPAADECGASKVGAYANQAATGDTMAKIRATIGHGSIRTINPGDAVTMDFRPDRLNIEIGEDGRIKRLRCG